MTTTTTTTIQSTMADSTTQGVSSVVPTMEGTSETNLIHETRRITKLLNDDLLLTKTTSSANNVALTTQHAAIPSIDVTTPVDTDQSKFHARIRIIVIS